MRPLKIGNAGQADQVRGHHRRCALQFTVLPSLALTRGLKPCANAALQAEAEPLVTALGLEKDETGNLPGPAPCFSYSGTYAGLKVYIVCNGALLQPARQLACMARV